MSFADTSEVSGMDVDLAVTPGPMACADGADGAGVTVITPFGGRLGIDLAELWRYRELLYFLAWRDLKARYKQTVLGVAWAVLRPVMTMVVFTAVFGRMAGIPSQGVPYSIFFYAGLLPWMLFSGAVSLAGVSLVNQAGLFTKVYFPRVYIPASSIAVVGVDFLLAAAVYGAIMVYYAHLPGVSVLLLPVLVLLVLILSLGLGTLLASLTVMYRDFRSIIPFMMQTWMYLSPVVYPVTLVPQQYRWLLMLNPMAGIVDAFRSCLLNQPVNWASLAVAAGIAVLMFVFGLYYFSRTERRFADIA